MVAGEHLGPDRAELVGHQVAKDGGTHRRLA
jgi:hypothetical protein